MSRTNYKEEIKNNKQIIITNTRTNDFHRKKGKLKVFSENLPKEIALDRVDESRGLGGIFKHKVTGEEFNKRTEVIQKMMKTQNETLVKVIKEFNTIYDTFSALDKEYIHGILISLKAAEEANSKALNAIDGMQTNQNKITEIINQQKQVIQVLKNFKEKIEKIEHLTDIDTIFGELLTMQSNLKTLNATVETHNLTLSSLKNEMKSIAYSQSVFQDQFQTLSKKFNQKHADLDTKLDSITNEVTTNKMKFENAVKEFNFRIEQESENMSTYLESEFSKSQNEIEKLNMLTGSLSKMLKTTQVISFASIAVICILVILIISGVL